MFTRKMHKFGMSANNNTMNRTIDCCEENCVPEHLTVFWFLKLQGVMRDASCWPYMLDSQKTERRADAKRRSGKGE